MSEVLDYLRMHFDKIEERLERIEDNIRSLNVRMSSIEATLGHVQIGQAEINSRLIALTRGIDRLERRAELQHE